MSVRAYLLCALERVGTEYTDKRMFMGYLNYNIVFAKQCAVRCISGSEVGSIRL